MMSEDDFKSRSAMRRLLVTSPERLVLEIERLRAENEKLRGEIETGQTVYGPQNLYGVTQSMQQSWHTWRSPGHTHRARVVRIEAVDDK